MFRDRLLFILTLALALLGLAACSVLPGRPSPATPTPTGVATSAPDVREAQVASVVIQVLESFPVQVNAVVHGSLPDACTQLGEFQQSFASNKFQITLLTVSPTDRGCVQALTPFEQTIPLAVAGLPAGTYSVVVNGVSGSFTLEASQVSSTPTSTTQPPAATPTNTPGATGQGDGACTYKATFVADVTIPDNTTLANGVTFVKTWRVRNDGTCTWGPSGYALHALKFVGGDQLGGGDVIPLPYDVPPGGTVDISVNMLAPANAGTYMSEWKFMVDNGLLVGVGPDGQAPLSVLITVGVADGACTYKAAFVADVTIPDNAVIAPGAVFVKTWRIRNDGTCTWGPTGYALHALKFVSGDKLGTPDTVALPVEVKPGNMVDVAISLTAPAAPGVYRGEWKLLVDNHPLVGVGSDGQAPLYAQIVVGAVTRISFDKGATTTSVEGSLKAGEAKDFVLYGLKDQLMLLTLDSLTHDVRLSVAGPGGHSPQVIRDIAGSAWIGQLPASQDYLIRVSAGNTDTRFSLGVEVPQRITFESGGVSATVTGATSARRTVTYLLRALAGQTMTAMLTSANNGVGLTIYGLQDGQPLVRAESGATSWTGKLPGTQDYVIKAVPNVDAASFTLQVTIK